MNDYSGNDPALFDHIQSALVGDLPSFGAATESKFQHLMHRNVGILPPHMRAAQSAAEMSSFNNLDTNLSVDAKAFQPTQGNAPGPQNMSSAIDAFENLDLASDMNGKLGYPVNNQPNPTANEFIPRNMSAPMLHQGQQNGTFSIPEFVPSRQSKQNITQQGNPMMNRPMGFQDTSTPRLPQHMAPIPRPNNPDFPAGMPMQASGSGTDSSVFASPSTQGNTFYTPDNTTTMPSGSAGRRRAASRELKASFRFIEDYVQRMLSRKEKREKGYTASSVAPPFPRQPVDSQAGNPPTTDRASPLLMRRMGGNLPMGKPPSTMSIDINSSQGDANVPHQPILQENRGTTYFYTQKANERSLPVVMSSFHVFPGPPPSVEYMSPKANAPSFFMPPEVRRAIIHKHVLTMATVDTEQDPSVPAEVDNYHSLFPLEAREASLPKSGTFGFVTSCYKAIKYKDGLPYCLRRIHSFRQVSEKCMSLVEMWKKVQHANIVQLREVFTSNAFGEHSLVFAHDYHAGAETMMDRHFKNPSNMYASKAKWVGGTARQNAGLLPESLIWIYVVQLTSALRCIHSAGLACRVLDLSKIIITDKSRIRINGVGVFDVLRHDSSHGNPRAHMQQYQQDDMISLGRVVLALACNSLTSCHPDNVTKSVDLVMMNYSNDLKNLIMYLLTPQQRPHSVNDIMPMIGARFYTHLDSALLRADVIENELAKEVENGRLFRMLCKLGIINERPEFELEMGWSETGDRYLLKLFRDHLFHQVTDTGAPWVDMSHIVQCLNKLDAGVPEKLCLMSRDEQNVLVVSYAELKKAYMKCYEEVTKTPSSL